MMSSALFRQRWMGSASVQAIACMTRETSRRVIYFCLLQREGSGLQAEPAQGQACSDIKRTSADTSDG